MSEQTASSGYAWLILAMATLVVCAALGLARFGYSVVLPAMQVGLHMDNTQAGALATANLVGYLVLSVLGGALASRFGPRAVITCGLAVVGLGMVLTGTARGIAEAAVWRGLTGVGSGASNVPVMGLLAAWFGARRRGLAAGIAVAGSSVALIVLGPTVPRLLSAYGDTGWRACWYGFGTVALLLAVAALATIRNRPAPMGLQPLGALPGEASLTMTGAVRWGAVYRSGTVWHLGLVYVAFGFSYIIFITFFVKRLVAEGGYNQPGAGRLFMTMGWCSLLCGLIWGSVSDAIGRKRALVLVYLVQAAAFGLFALWAAPPGFALSACLFGLTAWSIPAIMAAACGDILGPRLAPAGLGFVTLFMGVGQAAGPTVAGMVADATGSLGPAMLLAAGAALVGALGAATLRPAPNPQPGASDRP